MNTLLARMVWLGTSALAMVLGGCSIGSGGSGLPEGFCGASAISAERPAAATAAGSRLPMVVAVHDAAAECGVVALPNAGASVTVRWVEGRVVDVAVESEIFGGAETVRCLEEKIDAAGGGQVEGSARLRVVLAMLEGVQ